MKNVFILLLVLIFYPPSYVFGVNQVPVTDENDKTSTQIYNDKDVSKKVLVIGIDGMRPDAMEIAETPNINRLYKDGAGIYLKGYNEDLTFSGPNWSTIINGVHHDKHGVIRNSFDGHDFSEFPNFLRRLKDFNPNLFTASFIAWDPLLNNFSKQDGTADGVDMLFHYEGGESYETENDELLTQTLVELLREGNPDAIFIRIGELDGAGHMNGFSPHVPAYMNQVKKTDSYVGRILDALHERPGVDDGSENWLIIFTTDHGGIGTGHSGNYFRQRLIPFIVSGNSVIPESSNIRPRNVDVVRTALTFMGVPEDLQNNLDGRPIALQKPVITDLQFGKNLIINGNAELDRGFADRQRDQAISGWLDQEHTGSNDGYHSFTVLEYDFHSDFPGSESQGPSLNNRGKNFFAGGSKGNLSKMTQLLDLDSPLLIPEIRNHNVEYHLSGYLGGLNETTDRMQFTAYFLDKENSIIESTILNPVTSTDRGGITGLKYREAIGYLPPETRFVQFELLAISQCDGEIHACTGINAFADELSFVLNISEPN